MISAASESLHKYQMDLLFVIYQSTGMNSDDDECYQVRTNIIIRPLFI
jgi:hypothetical protein